ncbi:MAG: hypothetical protein ABJ118_14520, partial [Luteolibacter sp.]
MTAVSRQFFFCDGLDLLVFGWLSSAAAATATTTTTALVGRRRLDCGVVVVWTPKVILNIAQTKSVAILTTGRRIRYRLDIDFDANSVAV